MGFLKKLLGDSTDELQKRFEETRDEAKGNIEEVRGQAQRKLEEVRRQAQRKLEEVRLASNTEELKKYDSDIAKHFEDVGNIPKIIPGQLHDDDSPYITETNKDNPSDNKKLQICSIGGSSYANHWIAPNGYHILDLETRGTSSSSVQTVTIMSARKAEVSTQFINP